MLRILHDTNFDFIRWWKWAVGLTAGFIAIGLASFAINPRINTSIEFTGGTMMQVAFTKPLDVGALRSHLDKAGIVGAEIQQFGSNREFTIRAREAERQGAATSGAESVGRHIETLLKQEYGAGNVRVVRAEGVGPRVGNELTRDAIIAMLLSFLVTTVYLAIRFEWRFALAALIATSHDVITTLAFLKIMHLEVSLTVIAAILTVIGYSLNDTIIIFDRVREDLRKGRKESLYQTLNRAINETLPRSVMTHATTFAATLALLIFAGEVIRPFAWIMSFGIFTGTFSSIYIAGPTLLWIERKWPRKSGISKGSSTVTRTSPTRRSTATATR
ncbi:MAG TPA: protein translocase subunit SecF [Gemmatimonadaceae bacterium]|nr:protein translocase subunit SecF [Gemmatimonadaceae bacterium]